MTGFISDKVSDRLRSALAREDESTREGGAELGEGGEAEVEARTKDAGDDGIVTTEDELEGYRIVKAIVCDLLAPARVSYRDGKTYFAILVDDNNRKPLCRLHFNRSRKYIGTFDENKSETRHAIETLDGIYGVREILRATAQRWLAQDSSEVATTEVAVVPAVNGEQVS